jgi:hypothetical protein
MSKQCTRLNGVTFQKTIFFIFSAVRISCSLVNTSPYTHGNFSDTSVMRVSIEYGVISGLEPDTISGSREDCEGTSQLRLNESVLNDKEMLQTIRLHKYVCLYSSNNQYLLGSQTTHVCINILDN